MVPHIESGLANSSNTETNETHEIFLPEVDRCLFSSSSFGWLLTIRFGYEVHLLNPFTRDRILLPSVNEFQTDYLRVITSASPLNHPTCLLLATVPFEDELAFCRPDDKYWKYFQDFDGGRLDDAVFYKGEFYAVNCLGHIFHLDCNIGAARKLLCELPIDFLLRVHYNYLVELDGNLLVVVRYTRGEFTSGFEVYELNWVEKVWINVKNLGNNAILLGKSSSISLPINHLKNFKANCIYFLWDNLTGFRRETSEANYKANTGFYNMTTGQIENLYRSSPIWFSSCPLKWFAVEPPSPVIYKQMLQNRAEVICREKER